MSGLVQRCSACGGEIVLRRRHRGRTIACPGCGAAQEVPKGLDFLPLDRATSRDGWDVEFAAGLLALSFALCCFWPLAAGVWWWSSGVIQRAREEDRVVLPSLLRLRRAATVLTLVECVLNTALVFDRFVH